MNEVEKAMKIFKEKTIDPMTEFIKNLNKEKRMNGETCISEETREKLAEYAHVAWSGWMIYLFEKSLEVGDGCVEIPKWAVERWTRQATTEYRDLPEEEKESDRTEAGRMISIYESGNDAKKIAKFIANMTIEISELKAENNKLRKEQP